MLDELASAAVRARRSLPESLRRHIHDLETKCDPAGDLAARVLAEDQVDGLLELAFIPDGDSSGGWAKRLRSGPS